MTRRPPLALIIVALCLPTAALAQHDGKPAAQPADATHATPPADGGDMSMFMSQPGPEHALLKHFEGTWKAKLTFGVPGMEPVTSEGTMRNSIIFGGRFLQHDFTGELMGFPFKGQGLLGYDDLKKEWFNTWIDSTNNGIMVSRGTYDADSKTWTLKGTAINPETGKEETQREVLKLIDDDMHIMEMWGPGPDGQEAKMMEIVYTRIKDQGHNHGHGHDHDHDHDHKNEKKDDKKAAAPAGR